MLCFFSCHASLATIINHDNQKPNSFRCCSAALLASPARASPRAVMAPLKRFVSVTRSVSSLCFLKWLKRKEP